MAYIALYRKWRPGSFKDLAGQEHISRTLSRALVSGKVGHAYLFSGPRGTGKTSTAKILAKALNCEKGPTPDPCGVCENCRKIDEGASMDVFEIDAASNRGIDEIRDLRETVKFAPVDGRYKVYIIDEVHMLTTEAFNALLKTLEEPPSYVVFILATTEAHKVPATIQSRCQRYDFRRITVEDIEKRLHYVAEEMGFEAEPEALSLIAVQADGGLRDALSILDQCSSVSEGKVTKERVRQILGLVGHDWIFKLTEALAKRRSQEILVMLAELLREGKELKQILGELSLHLRSLMIYQAAGTVEQMDLYAEPAEVLREQEAFFSQERIMEIIHRLHETMNELKWSPQPRIAVEVAFLSLCREESGERRAEGESPVASSGDESRIARLEARLAQMAAQLAEEKSTSASKPAPVLPASPKPPAAKPVSPRRRSVDVAPMEESPEGIALWKEVLEGFRAANKKNVLACLGQGKCIGMSETQLFVRFPGDMMASLADRIYRKSVEENLARLAGRDLQLVCSALPAPPKAPPKTKKPPAEKKRTPSAMKPDLEDLTPEEQANVQHAVDILGGHFIPSPEADAATPSGDDTAPHPEDDAAPPPGDDAAPPPEEDE